MKRWGLAVIAVLVAACASSSSATDPAAAVEMIDTDGNRGPTLDASRDASRLAALDVRTTGCGPREGFGSASLIDDGLAITAAHVVAGVDDITVIDQQLVEHEASVIVFDPELDIAILRVPTGLGTPLEFFGGRVEAGDLGAITVTRERDDAGAAVTLDVDVLRRANVATTDIYRDLDVVRPGFEVAAGIEPGDSGAVVVLTGRAAGVVWSRSIELGGRAWVVNIPAPYREVERPSSIVESVETGECA